MILNKSSSRQLFLAKAFYFLFFAAGAAFSPFLPLYYQQLHLSGREMGMLIGMTPLVSLVSAPVWAAVADLTQRHKLTLLVSMVGAMLMVGIISQTTRFSGLLVAVPFYAFFTAPIIPIIDSTVLGLLGEHRDQYGKQRMWGAVGWGISGPVVGFLTQRYDLRLCFYVYIAFFFLGLFVAARLPVHRSLERPHLSAGLKQLVLNRSLGPFWITVFISGISMALVSNYLFIHLAGLGASRSLMGIALAFSTVSEIVIFQLSDRMLRNWGPKTMIAVSMGCYVVRSFAYSVMGAPWLALPIQLLHGPTFSMMWTAGVSFASQIAPHGLGATAQSLFTSITFGLGGIAGGLAGGWLYDAVGTGVMFRMASGLVLVALVVFLLMERGARQAESTAA